MKNQLFYRLFLFFLLMQGGVVGLNAQSREEGGSRVRGLWPIARATWQWGKFIDRRGPFFTGLDADGDPFHGVRVLALEYGWQTSGEVPWHQACKFPKFGIGVQYMRVLNRSEMGHPISVYGFFDGNYFWSKHLELTNRIGFGVATGFRPYDPADSIPNDIIATNLNAFIELGVGFAVRVKKGWYLEPGFRFTHFSNGNIREPQLGINVVAYSLGVRAPLSQQLGECKRQPKLRNTTHHEVLAFLGISTRQIDFSDDKVDSYHYTYDMNYLMTNLHTGYQYQFGQRVKLGGGFDFFYDGTNGQREAARTGPPSRDAVPFSDKLGVSAYIGGESVVERLSILGTLGYTIARTDFDSSSPRFEQRLGFKYHFYKNVFAGINVRAYRFKSAKALEFNIGVRRFL